MRDYAQLRQVSRRFVLTIYGAGYHVGDRSAETAHFYVGDHDARRQKQQGTLSATTLPKEVLLQALSGIEATTESTGPSSDMTVADVSRHFQRSRSTVRGWLEARRFPGAWKLNGRDWRVPLGGIEAFVEQQRRPRDPNVVDIGEWRRHRTT